MLVKQKLNMLNYVLTTEKIYNNFNDLNNLELKRINSNYDFEILLMTNSSMLNQFNNIIDWIYWHLNIIGINHITVVHNNCNDDLAKNKLQKICSMFNSVDYYYEDKGNQEFIFNKYLPLSTAKYTICIDEDEFIYIKNNKTIHDIKLNTDYFKFSIPMINFYSDKIIHENLNSYLTAYQFIDLTNKTQILDNGTYFKTFVDNRLNHYISNIKTDRHISVSYNNTKTIPQYTSGDIVGTVHNPCTILNNTYLPSYNLADNKQYYKHNTLNQIDINKFNIFIAHYKYRSEKEYLIKIHHNKFDDVSENYYLTYNNELYYRIYNNSESFTKYSNLNNMYNAIKEDCNNLKIKY